MAASLGWIFETASINERNYIENKSTWTKNKKLQGALILTLNAKYTRVLFII